ncbi:hypothetical protein HQ576_01535, partial [bacterium]|nr:hypothetical protein [bacterium]
MLLSLAANAAPSAEEQRTARAWVGKALLGAKPSSLPAPPGLQLVRQDHGKLGLRRSVLDTPLQI